jgi:4-hydroxythreonine-4-phosphate dehydrogenase
VRPIAVTMGEPAGIGPELAAMAWLRRAELPTFFVRADPALIRDRALAAGLDVNVVEVEPGDADSLFERGLPVVPLVKRCLSTPGLATVETAPAVIESIEGSVADVREGRARAVVTAPIMKDVLYRAGFHHPGHTEYLGELALRHWGAASVPVMMIWSELLAVVPVTIHVPLREVPRLLTEELIVTTAAIVARDLAARFGLRAPRLALSGLNPHAGENGALGSEDEEVIAPAVARLRSAGIDAVGPLPADTMFHERARKGYDVAICMYHDQALAPAKALAFDEAVNVTLGLPFVRTSPDHGTAFELAGTGRANPASFIASLKLADRLTRS